MLAALNGTNFHSDFRNTTILLVISNILKYIDKLVRTVSRADGGGMCERAFI